MKRNGRSRVARTGNRVSKRSAERMAIASMDAAPPKPAGAPGRAAGTPALLEFGSPAAPRRSPQRRALVLGGAGFIGTNLCARLLQNGVQVTAFDNLSRPGSELHLGHLKELGGGQFRFLRGDVRDAEAVLEAARGQDEIYHLAAQVAVTSSVEDPREDFAVNAGGTVNILEAARRHGRKPFVLFTSTNKVYGAIAEQGCTVRANRYEACLGEGISEHQPLDFHSPYGCSKGAADQYMRDYARVYGLPTVVFRMSCIYGPQQFGTEDQGWVAHFALCALLDEPLTIYGDGRQVRDLLYVDDLVEAMQTAYHQRQRVAGQVFNMGGGRENARSLLEVIAQLRQLSGRPMDVQHGPWRVGDQRIYISDTRRFQRETGWRAQVDADRGVRRLYQWLSDHHAMVRAVRGAPATRVPSSIYQETGSRVLAG